MADAPSKNINKKTINFNLFDSSLFYIIILIINNIPFKAHIFKKEKKPLFSKKGKKPKELSNCAYRVGYGLEIKNESEINTIINETENEKNRNNQIKEREIIKINNGINDRNLIISNYFIITFITFLILNIFCEIKSNFLLNLFYFQDSKITLKIKGIGYSLILGNENGNSFAGINYIKEIYINGKKQDSIEYKYYFNKKDNFVELIFDNNINHCGYMFWKCSNITEINLSNFDTSHVTAMNAMFSYCSSLTSLDLSNLKTSLVKFMNWMFAYCSSLTSLNLSKFVTSKVIDMNDMLVSCSSLTSLNLSNFDTSQLTNTNNMFKDCSNLEYIIILYN